jgi:TatD DNase family protein
VKIPYIDIHTHNRIKSEEIVTIQSLFLQDIDLQNHINELFSAAIHPWHAASYTSEKVKPMLDMLIKQPLLIAIGETGLDKACAVNYEVQKKIFELQLEFAEFHSKPVIIHAVKSFSEIIQYLKKAKVKIVLHGYSAGVDVTKQLIDLGCYFSLGKSVLQITPRLREVVSIIPPSSLFLETDDSKVSIVEIYSEASKILALPLEDLKIQIHRNFESLFCKR